MSQPVMAPSREAVSVVDRPIALARPPQAKPRLFTLPTEAPLVAVLALQAVLSLRLVWSNSAFIDEGEYLWAGHLEWAHWLHGTPIPSFQSYFSGAPVLYPPIAALADSVGGLAGARLLSLAMMLGATALLWSATNRLFDRTAAFFAAALFAVLGPTIFLSSFAVYDPMALLLMALSTWLVCRAGTSLDATKWVVASALALALANATSYASVLFDPLVVVVAILAAFPLPGGRYALMRAASLLTCTVAFIILMLALASGSYGTGFDQTTVGRGAGTASVLSILGEGALWTLPVLVAAGAAVVASLFARNKSPRTYLVIALAGGLALAPLAQAHLRTTTSLQKHVDFGAWFGAMAAGWVISRLVELLRGTPRLRLGVLGMCVALLVVPEQIGAVQSAGFFRGWPDSAAAVTQLRPVFDDTSGPVLVQNPSVLEYYLPSGTQWARWSSTTSIRLPSGKSISVPVGELGNPSTYVHFIDDHYFTLIAIEPTLYVEGIDRAILSALSHNRAYHKVSGLSSRRGLYVVWELQPGAARR